jgi:hypothetical protein
VELMEFAPVREALLLALHCAAPHSLGSRHSPRSIVGEPLTIVPRGQELQFQLSTMGLWRFPNRRVCV